MNCPKCNIELRKSLNEPYYDYSPIISIGKYEPDRILCTISIDYDCTRCGIELKTNDLVDYIRRRNNA